MDAAPPAPPWVGRSVGAGITTHNGISEISPLPLASSSLAALAPFPPPPSPPLALAAPPRPADILLYKRDCTFSIVSAAVLRGARLQPGRFVASRICDWAKCL